MMDAKFEQVQLEETDLTQDGIQPCVGYVNREKAVLEQSRGQKANSNYERNLEGVLQELRLSRKSGKLSSLRIMIS
jgi:hypothetical protein